MRGRRERYDYLSASLRSAAQHKAPLRRTKSEIWSLSRPDKGSQKCAAPEPSGTPVPISSPRADKNIPSAVRPQRGYGNSYLVTLRLFATRGFPPSQTRNRTCRSWFLVLAPVHPRCSREGELAEGQEKLAWATAQMLLRRATCGRPSSRSSGGDTARERTVNSCPQP